MAFWPNADLPAVAARVSAVESGHPLNAREYVNGDGTDETTGARALFQAAYDEGRPIDLSGIVTLKTDTITYRNQSFFGGGPSHTAIVGLPGKDVFVGDQTLSQFAVTNGAVRDITIKVDDSVDVSGTTNRGGVGNACMAWDYLDGAVAPKLRPLRQTFENVTMTSTSGTTHGLNNSAGIYTAMPFIQPRWRNLVFERTVYSYWEHWPTTNTTSIEVAGDHGQIDSVYFSYCGKAGRWVNQSYFKFGNIVCHQNLVGPAFEGIQSAIRALPAINEIAVMMLEENGTTPLVLKGRGYKIGTLSVSGSHTILTLACDASEVKILNVSSGSGAIPYLRLTGNRNEIKGVQWAGATAATYARDLVDDQGKGNTIEQAAVTGARATRVKRREAIGLDDRVLHKRDATAMLLGYTDPMFVGGSDLLVHPELIIPTGVAEGVGYSYTSDAAAPLGRALRVPGGSFYADGPDALNGSYGFTVGDFLPPGRVRVYVCAKFATGGTQVWKVSADAVDKASATLTFTTTYTVQSFDVDLTGLTSAAVMRLTANAIGGGGAAPLDVAWVGFRPHPKDVLGDAAAASSYKLFEVGRYVTTDHPTVSTAALTLEWLAVAPLRVARAVTLDLIGVEITTAGAAGAVVRLGIYSDNGYGAPGALLLDAGTVDATSTGFKSVAISEEIAAGTLIWIGGVAQVAASTVRSCSGNVPGVAYGAVPGSAVTLTSLRLSPVAGALPGSWGTSRNLEALGYPRTWLRASA